jgi:DNA mismatch repair protein MutS2
VIRFDVIAAKAKLAIRMKACLPYVEPGPVVSVIDACHPLLFLYHTASGKPTVPFTLTLKEDNRILVISGPNAGGKTVCMKTIGLLQLMLQSGLLIPVNSSSRYSFFENILIDIGDTQSIENELSTYSAKLKSMNEILSKANEASLILMDEFGSGTDPELGSAIAETVLESIVKSKAKGIITTHFGKVKLLADKLEGCVNASMLFDLEKLEPYYKLNIGEPGSSFTFEVAEKIGFPKHLILKAKEKINKNELKLNYLIAELQEQKAKLELQQQLLDHETFVMKIAKEKYHTLFNNWEEKINKERERKIELSNMADFGQKYIRLMNDWKEKKERKTVIKRFIDGITAETKKQELLKKQNLKSDFAEKKIKRLKPQLKIGSKVRVLNGSEIGEIENIKDNKVLVQMGLMKITVGIENLILVE